MSNMIYLGAQTSQTVIPSCLSCANRIGLASQPADWRCGIAGYSTRRERFEIEGDDPTCVCGRDAAWWEPRKPESREIPIGWRAALMLAWLKLWGLLPQ